MNEREVMNALNSVDEDILDEKIDEWLAEKGESIDMDSIKEKAVNKLKEREGKKKRLSRRLLLGLALAASLAITSVYAGEISDALKSFINKSAVYSTVVDGAAYYLVEEVTLNEQMSLTSVSVSKDQLSITIRTNGEFDTAEFNNMDISVTPKNSRDTTYAVGGMGSWGEDQYGFSFYNEKEKNHHIEPFDAFELTLGSETYLIELTEAEAVKVDESLSIGVSGSEEPGETPSVAHMAGNITEKDGKRQIRLIPAFEDPDLRMSALGEPKATEYKRSFENNETGSIGVSSGSVTKPITAADRTGYVYKLTVPTVSERGMGVYNTVFEIDAKAETPLTVELPAILAHYEKEVAKLTLPIPKDGETFLDQELDFIIQKAIVKSIKRIADDTAVVELELNTGADSNIFITDIGAYSQEVAKAETVVKGNTAVMTMTFEPDLEEASFRFSYPHYVIWGDWSIMLGE